MVDRHSKYAFFLDLIKVIICESDSDCRFYSAILQAVIEKKNLSSQDFMFIHCGGKHRIPQVVNALKKLDVAMEVICDFDVLNNSWGSNLAFGDNKNINFFGTDTSDVIEVIISN